MLEISVAFRLVLVDKMACLLQPLSQEVGVIVGCGEMSRRQTLSWRPWVIGPYCIVVVRSTTLKWCGVVCVARLMRNEIGGLKLAPRSVLVVLCQRPRPAGGRQPHQSPITTYTDPRSPPMVSLMACLRWMLFQTHEALPHGSLGHRFGPRGLDT